MELGNYKESRNIIEEVAHGSIAEELISKQGYFIEYKWKRSKRYN